MLCLSAKTAAAAFLVLDGSGLPSGVYVSQRTRRLPDGKPLPSNTRNAAAAVFADKHNTAQIPWFGLEQVRTGVTHLVMRVTTYLKKSRSSLFLGLLFNLTFALFN